MNRQTILIILSVLVSFILNSTVNVLEVHNTRQEIEACLGKIKLTLIRTWGGDEIDDINQFFKYPMDILVGKDGLIYICDSSNNRIQVFDEAGHFRRTLGRGGNGPTDFLSPNAISQDIQGNIIVSDRLNYRIQVLTPDGKYISGFKYLDGWISGVQAAHKRDEIVINCYKKAFFSKKLLFIHDKKGKLVREIGQYVSEEKKLLESESVFFTIDESDNIYTAFSATPYLQKFSFFGDLSMFISYELPYKAPVAIFDKIKKNVEIRGKSIERAAYALSVDQKMRVYLVMQKRLKTKEELNGLGLSSVMTREGREERLKRPPVESENTDLYRLLVFSPTGKVIATAQLNVFCTNIYTHNGHLFVIDSLKAMKIYEYKISFR